jgi:hypothetical protein
VPAASVVLQVRNVRSSERGGQTERIDGDGVIRWHADARGDSSVMMLIGNGLVKNFRAALLQLAQQAGEAFRSPGFWAALRGPS